MATKIFISRAALRAQIDTFTVGGTAANGQTYSVTINTKAVTYTAISGDTNTTIAAGLLAALNATEIPEFQEITWTVSALVITGTANTAGVPFTATSTASGTGTLTRAASVANSSPSDVSDANNWSSASLPTTGDDLVFEASDIPAIYGLTATFDPATVTIRESFGGPIGQPAYNSDGGYYEYRGTTFQCTAAATVIVQQSSIAQAGHYKLSFTSDVVTITVSGSSGGSGGIGQEVVWLTGTAANSVIEVYGGSLLLAPLTGDTAVVTTVRVIDGVLRATAGVTFSSSTINQTRGVVDVTTNVQTWNIDGDGAVGTIRGTATATTISVDSGLLNVLSTGTITTLNVGSGATVDFSGVRGAITVTNCVIAAGATINDPDRRVTWTNGIKLTRCTLGEVALNLGVHLTLTPSAY